MDLIQQAVKIFQRNKAAFNVVLLPTGKVKHLMMSAGAAGNVCVSKMQGLKSNAAIFLQVLVILESHRYC